MGFRRYLIVGFSSLTLIPLELAWTRIFSAEFFYTFAFLVLSTAILGLGLGALAVRMFSRLYDDRLLGIYLTLAGVAVILSPIAAFRLGIDFTVLFSSLIMIGKLVLMVLLLMSGFLFIGMALALVFRRHHRDMPRLYMSDLLGAGIGVLLAIWLMNLFETPVAAFLIALPVLLAAFLASRGWLKAAPVVCGCLIVVFAPGANGLFEKEVEERAPVIYRHWDAMAKVKVYDFGAGYRGLNIDNVANSPVHQFDGNWEDMDSGETEWGINVSHLIQQFDSCVFLSLGAGGGSDVLQALAEGATEVHAVEINPHINHMMTRGDPGGYLQSNSEFVVGVDADTVADGELAATPDSVFDSDQDGVISLAEFSGHIYDDPRVKVITEDGRAYVRRFHNRFDIIYSLSSNTWAALASGSFALAENYLFTTEAFIDYWNALTERGFLMMEHQVYMPRLVSEVVQTLDRLHVANPHEHFVVYDLPQMRRNVILLSKQPLSHEIYSKALGKLSDEKYDRIHTLFPPANDSIESNLINQLVLKGWRNLTDSATIDISPVTDDRPFVAQMGLWRNVTGERMQKLSRYAEFSGFPLSSLILLILLGIIVVFIIPLTLLPCLRSGPKLTPASWLYFFTIGVAFMAVEIILIQRYALLIGSSLHSLVTVLVVLLIASAVGSRAANRVSTSFSFSFLIGWLVFEAFFYPALVSIMGGEALWLRMAATAVLIAPLGFLMGMPFPKGALKVGSLIDWGFAVNGAASVLGSVLVLLTVFSWGFRVGLLLAAGCYLVAFFLLQRMGSQLRISPDAEHFDELFRTQRLSS